MVSCNDRSKFEITKTDLSLASGLRDSGALVILLAHHFCFELALNWL